MSEEVSIIEGKKSDCLSCRLIRGFGCICIGSYLILQGKQLKGYNRGSLFIFGGCIGVLGMANLFDINLFNKSTLS